MARLSIKIALWLILPLVCVEFLMIVLDPYLFKGFYQYDPDLGFRVRAYYHNSDGTLTNQFGFNDQDYSLQKTPGTFRILVVGDSFGWAGGREGNYTALLERMFESHYGYHKIDVINAGYPMTHTAEQLAMLKKYGLRYNPDLVILGFFVGNDFLDADPNRKRIIVNGLYVDIGKRREHRILGYPLISRSRVRLFIEQKYRVLKELREAGRESATSNLPREQGTFSEETFLNIERAHLEFSNINSFRGGRFQNNINYILQSISEMDGLLKSRNMRFIVAIYPDEFQVDRNLLGTIFGKFGLSPENYDTNLAQTVLKSFLKSKGIPYIDLLDVFKAEGEQRSLYLLRNTHWNGAGNQLAADILYLEIVKQLDKINSQSEAKMNLYGVR
jgi:hypothetical protein